MTSPFGFFWEVSSPSLLQEQEADLQLYLTHMRDKTADYFILKVRVRHQTCWTTDPQQPQSHDPVLGAIDTFACHSSILMQAQEFLQNGSSHMQLHFPDAVIPNVLIHQMMPDVISYAEAIIQTRRSGFLYERPDFRLFSLNLDIIIQNSLLFVDDYDDIITDFIIEESMENTNIKMVPTSKNAIDSLEEVKLEKNNNATERCSICLSEFDYGDDAEQVLSMPCKHVYHQECIIHWLKTSHLCPLCRYPMPTD
ncbi:E3 ubiquitin-protein ligase SGR9, amyloplastic-like [Arachis ipaensis]|uniref:E3 ubiquitin-protein ligase SGR9, amyloplastic-like n=1 Tax=Arachis ipaensis TaxID=130454 RepID=UPI0007AF76C8|nr:E3 ubiquitin-protein ligase SGR9, amyloplastic-like [Arachis ipaensis]XP_025661952.1 E3 ubiquitin-protein ligase SGR9, amyloplastic-like [Arachis hypogaea]QHN87229.1 E3 ubiquitin-protein ligase RING1-like [Arachis hypogaea]